MHSPTIVEIFWTCISLFRQNVDVEPVACGLLASACGCWLNGCWSQPVELYLQAKEEKTKLHKCAKAESAGAAEQ